MTASHHLQVPSQSMGTKIAIALINRFKFTTILGTSFLVAGGWAGWWAVAWIQKSEISWIPFVIHACLCVVLVSVAFLILWPQIQYERTLVQIDNLEAIQRLNNLRTNLPNNQSE